MSNGVSTVEDRGDGPAAPNAPPAVPGFAVESYRYLRLSIVVVVLALMASVLIERSHATCFQESISAYFYTPVQSMFVVALVVIGVTLIAIKGRPGWEDVLLNLAGVLAAIVAFVPTSPPSHQCSSIEVVAVDAEPYIDNNVVAFLIGGLLALAFAFALAKLQSTSLTFDKESRFGLAAGLAIAVVGTVWYFGYRESFLERAHGGAAVAMFVVVGFVITYNAYKGFKAPDRAVRKRYWLGYALIAAAMTASVVGVVVAKAVAGDWRHQILWLELLELSAFGVYWVAQTVEHWDGGVPAEVKQAEQ